MSVALGHRAVLRVEEINGRDRGETDGDGQGRRTEDADAFSILEQLKSHFITTPTRLHNPFALMIIEGARFSSRLSIIAGPVLIFIGGLSSLEGRGVLVPPAHV